MTALALLRRLLHELGVLGLASIALLAAAFLFLVLALKPLEARDRALEHQIQSSKRNTANGALIRTSTPAARIAAFYEFLASGRQATDSLDQLYATAKASGVELRTAEYRMQTTGTRIERYEIRVPLRASYAQVRTFLDTILAEIPMLSLEEVKFKRESASDSLVETELHLALHLVNP